MTSEEIVPEWERDLLERQGAPFERLPKIECPLCDWVHTPETARYAASNLAAAPSVASALGMPADSLLSIHMHQALQRDERAIDQHMRTHPPQDWLPELMRLRAQVDELGGAS